MAVLLVSVIGGVLLALIPAAIARTKRRSFFGWWVFGLLLWVPALICAILIQPLEPRSPFGHRASSERQCPNCRTRNSEAAARCLGCGQELRSVPARSTAVSSEAPAADSQPADEVRKLASLRDNGHLTAEEFEQAKARLLDRL